VFQPGDGAGPHAGRRERQPATNPFHDVFGLIVAKMMLAPEVEGLLHDLVERMRLCFLTTQYAPWDAFASSHGALVLVE
jgi:hypothetical protein